MKDNFLQRVFRSREDVTDADRQQADICRKYRALRLAVALDPYNSETLEAYALQLMKAHDGLGYTLLEGLLRPEMTPPLSVARKRDVCICLALYHGNAKRDAILARTWVTRAMHFEPGQQYRTLLATCIVPCVESVTHAREQVEMYHFFINMLLVSASPVVPVTDHSSTTAEHVMSGFYWECFYEADLRKCMQKYAELIRRLFEPHAFPISRGIRRSRAPWSIAVASAYFSPVHSVTADFQGVFTRLDRARFQITFVNFSVYNKPNHFAQTVFANEPRLDVSLNQLEETRAAIRAHSFDMILYLDSTMIVDVHRLMLHRLAPVQAVTHGHPVTTGISSSVLDYYISWGAAELPTAQDHYTEKLVLLDAEVMHQYYERRLDANRCSVLTGMPVTPYGRGYFAERYGVKADRRWYVCMQQPFKLHPEFDELCLGILARDPQGLLLVMLPSNLSEYCIFEKRWRSHWSQIHHLPMLPHHELMGLYLHVDVVLDSYYAGGCTTTREALEVGAPVVTLPGKYLGGRWSAAYYRKIGYEELIARDKEHYVELALQVGPAHRQAILQKVGALFQRWEAVASWEKVLEDCVNLRIT